MDIDWTRGVVILVVAFTVSVILGFVLGLIKRRPAKALIWPVQTLIWVFAFTYEVDLFGYEEYTALVRKLAIAIALFWFVGRYIQLTHRHFVSKARAGESEFSHGQIDALSKLATIVVIVGLVLVVMQILEVNIQALIAIGGFGSLAIGYAGRDVIANFFSGFMLYLTHPFRVGDRIEALNGSFEGEVERIGWYYTTIRAKDTRPVYLPNSLFSSAGVINSSRAKS